MERKLASIQTVKDVTKIFHPATSELTNLELVTFENIGWQCVAKRGEFQSGDKAVYIEISSIVPEHPVFEFLRARKFKVKTIRLLGVLSQGLALPVSILKEFNVPENLALGDGDDVTEVIGVKRREEEEVFKIANGGPVRTFPTDIAPKTDEIRVQSMPHILAELKNIGNVVATLKIDGTSSTFFWDEEKSVVRVCSRNMEKLSDDGSVYFLILKEYPQIEVFLRENPAFVLQGEIAAPGIQKNRLGLKKPQFFAFNLYNTVAGTYEPQYNFEAIMGSYKIPIAPVVYFWKVFDETVESLLEKAKGFYSGTNNPQEGIVLRPYYEERFSYLLGGRVSCKVINNEYLLSGGE